MLANTLVVEDHPLYKEALVDTAQRAGLGLACRAVGTAAEARLLVRQMGPFHLALVDQRLPDGDGLGLLQELAPSAAVRVLLTGLDEPGLAHQARQLGLAGYMPKSLPAHEMVVALKKVMAGERWFPPSLPAELPPLSQRQLQVLREVGLGKSNRRIAADLGIGERTVKEHLSVIFVRLGASNRAEAVAQAGAMGLLLFESRQ
jgi:DNA-binding NarL/FixJ family response regulator